MMNVKLGRLPAVLSQYHRLPIEKGVTLAILSITRQSTRFSTNQVEFLIPSCVILSMAKKISKEQVIRNAIELADQLKSAVAALDSETNPDTLLNHMGTIRDQGRTEALRRVLQEQSLELFKAQGRI